MTSTLVSERALMRRVNRRLAHQGEQIRRVRPGMRRDRMFAFANYYTLNTNRNLIVDGFSDLEGTARDLGVFRDWEQLDSRTS